MQSIPVDCVLVGDGGVGKTCMLISFTQDHFPMEYVPTLFDIYNHPMTVDGQSVTLKLSDTPGQPDYSRLRALSYNSADILLICFSIDNKDSYDNIQSFWIPEIRHYHFNAPIIIVGLKTDLRKFADDNTYQKLLTSEDGEDMAAAVGAVKYVECSALAQLGLNEVFTEAVSVALHPEKYDFKRAGRKKVKCSLL